jgi:hypothetical protein
MKRNEQHPQERRRDATPQDQRRGNNPQDPQQSNALETQIRENWMTIRQRLQEDYDNLTSDDLRYVPGQESDLIGRIQKRTGQTRQQFQQWVENEVVTH